jgi:3-oxoacyl-[acyl-carrier protein] reductase
MRSLEGRVAVVTGAARGIGLRYACRLASMGANVAVSDLDLGSAGQYQREQSHLVNGDLDATLRQYGRDVLTVQADASIPEDLDRFAEVVREQLGPVDVLVCNAGGGSDIDGSRPTELVPALMQATFARNLYSVIYTVGAFAGEMKRRRTGKIITISSYAGTTALPGAKAADYATAKAGVAHYTRCLAQELAPYGVTANAIAPGFIATGQWLARFGKDDDEVLQRWEAEVPLGRLGTAEDCANVLEFLACDLSNYLTGQIIAVDGGLTRYPS